MHPINEKKESLAINNTLKNNNVHNYSHKILNLQKEKKKRKKTKLVYGSGTI